MNKKHSSCSTFIVTTHELNAARLGDQEVIFQHISQIRVYNK